MQLLINLILTMYEIIIKPINRILPIECFLHRLIIKNKGLQNCT